MNKKYLVTFYLFMLLVSPAISYAQGGLDDDGDVPIDGGISILLAAGVAYGVKRVRETRRENANEDEG
jgi:hypothetical protein